MGAALDSGLAETHANIVGSVLDSIGLQGVQGFKAIVEDDTVVDDKF